MMYLRDLRDYVAGLGIAAEQNVYMGKMTNKNNCSIGVYHLDRAAEDSGLPIGGVQNASYGVKSFSILVHWNESPTDTEIVSQGLYGILESTKNIVVNNKRIQFIKMITNEPKDVGTDDYGIYEMVIQIEIYYER